MTPYSVRIRETLRYAPGDFASNLYLPDVRQAQTGACPEMAPKNLSAKHYRIEKKNMGRIKTTPENNTRRLEEDTKT